MMRRIIWVCVIAVTLTALSGCKGKKADKGVVKGVVTTVDASRLDDTIRSMKVLVDDEDTLIFNMYTAKYENELMVPKDSVVVKYANDLHGDTLRAVEISVIPQKGTVVNLDSMKHNKLITR